jgi:hypothetical protein
VCHRAQMEYLRKMKTISERFMPKAKSDVNWRRPLTSPSLMRLSRPGSKNGARPERSTFNFTLSDSTPITW